jgi:hypothetical protein
LDTFAEEIADPVASRVFARSAFEYGHEPDAPDVGAAMLAVTVVQAAFAVAVVVLPRPQAATSKPPASRAALSVMRQVVRTVRRLIAE